MSAFADELERVRAYYARKTASVLDKYGPGPRVHFHTGLVEPGSGTPENAAAIRVAMVRAQEALLEHVRDDAPARPRGRVLDIGCGLGGGALFFAAEEEVDRVTAITIEPTHVAVVRQFAAHAQVADRVDALLLDAHETASLSGFDHAVAIESSCYLRRDDWASATRTALKPGGYLHIVDCFRAPGASLAWFDAYWQTRLGDLSEYASALRRAGFDLLVVEDLALRAAPFWDLSCAWIAAEVIDDVARGEKLVAHRSLQRALRDGSLCYLRLVARAR